MKIMKNKASISHQRKVQTYLKTRAFRMFKADTLVAMRSVSDHASHIITKYYEGLSEIKQRELLEEYERRAKTNTLNKI